MRTRLTIKDAGGDWVAEYHPSVEHALYRWLCIPVKDRRGGLLSATSSPPPRNPSYAEVNLGYLLVAPDVRQASRHLFGLAFSGKDIDDEFPRVARITLPWAKLPERSHLRPGPERSGWESFLADILRDNPPGFDLDWRSPSASGPSHGAGDVEDAEWREVGESERTERTGPTVTVRVPVEDGRRALAVCADLSETGGFAYRARCAEARGSLDAFVSAPEVPSARRLARASGGLADALPDAFPSHDLAGLWGTVARPALWALAEAAHAWAHLADLSATVAVTTDVPSSGPAAPESPPAEAQASTEDAQPTDAAAPVGGMRHEPVPEPVPAPAVAAHPVPARIADLFAQEPAEAEVGAEPASRPARTPRKRRSDAGPDARERIVAPAAPARFDLRVLEAMRGLAPSRKVEIASAMGCGRGQVNHAVNRLVSLGLVLTRDGSRFEIAEARP